MSEKQDTIKTYSVNNFIHKKLFEIEMLLDGEHALLGVQDWALKKYNGQVVKIIRQYIEEIRKIVA